MDIHVCVRLNKFPKRWEKNNNNSTKFSPLRVGAKLGGFATGQSLSCFVANRFIKTLSKELKKILLNVVQ